MSDPNSPDRVPLDRPPVPRFSPLPDLPDLPEMPRGSAPLPTPSIPIPAPPPMPSLPAPRVVVDLPRPSPSVTIDAPSRPIPRGTPPTAAKPAEPKPPAPTPAPQGRWVGEAITTLLRPTKSKATVVAAAGSLVAAAFVMQLVVGTGSPSTPSTARTVASKSAEVPPPVTPAAEPQQPGEFAMPAIPTPVGGVAVTAVPFPKLEPVPLPWTPEDTPPPVKIKPAAFPSPEPGFTLAGGQTPAGPMIPTLPDVPAPPVTTPVPAAPDPVRVTLPTLPPEVPKAAPLPALPPKPVEVKPVEVKPVALPKPPTPEPFLPTTPPKPAFVDLTPPPPVLQAAPVPPLPSAFVPVEPPPEPRRVTPTPVPPPVGEARTDYDVDLHPAQAGQTYEAVSKQHYNDAKYADALRAYNRNRDPGRDELQIPPVYVVRKLAPAGRTPPAANPIAPAGGETWAPPATLGGSRPAAGRSYTVPDDGLTFRDLAGTLLNDRTKYRRISDLNPSLDPNAKLRKGDKVTVP